MLSSDLIELYKTADDTICLSYSSGAKRRKKTTLETYTEKVNRLVFFHFHREIFDFVIKIAFYHYFLREGQQHPRTEKFEFILQSPSSFPTSKSQYKGLMHCFGF